MKTVSTAITVLAVWLAAMRAQALKGLSSI